MKNASALSSKKFKLPLWFLGMRLFLFFLFLTLVGSDSIVLAATSSSILKPSPPSDQSSEIGKPADFEKSQALQWTPPDHSPLPGDTVGSLPVFRKLQSPWHFGAHAGLLTGQILEASELETTSLIGGTFTWEDAPERAWDFEADAMATNCIRLGVARRFEISSMTIGSQPYWSVGLTQTLQGRRLLVSVIDLERIKAMASFGFADFFDQDRQWTIEAGVGWGLTGAVFNLQGGWAFH